MPSVQMAHQLKRSPFWILGFSLLFTLGLMAGNLLMSSLLFVFIQGWGVETHWQFTLQCTLLLFGFIFLMPQARRWLPQVRRQTPYRWKYLYSTRLSLLFWGIDLGMVFSTWLIYPGALVLLGWTVPASSFFGLFIIYAFYQAGRAVWYLALPLYLSSNNDRIAMLDRIDRNRNPFVAIQLIGLMYLSADLLLG